MAHFSVRQRSPFWKPCSMPLRAQESAVTWAANGVDLREPLKPAEPADSQAMTFPSLSVSDTMVLLNDVLMCAWPIAMFLRTRRRVRPRAAGLLRALARAAVRLRALALDGQAAPVPDAAVGADLAQPLDRLRALATEVALDLEVLVDVLAQLRDLLVGEVTDLRVLREAERRADLARGRLADAVDVGQPDLETLLIRQVHSGDACQPTLLALSLLVTRIRADDQGRAVPLDDAAPLAHGLDGCSDLHAVSFMRTNRAGEGAVKEVRAHTETPCGAGSS